MLIDTLKEEVGYYVGKLGDFPSMKAEFIGFAAVACSRWCSQCQCTQRARPLAGKPFEFRGAVAANPPRARRLSLKPPGPPPEWHPINFRVLGVPDFEEAVLRFSAGQRGPTFLCRRPPPTFVLGLFPPGAVDD